jgi:hypothetical protein
MVTSPLKGQTLHVGLDDSLGEKIVLGEPWQPNIIRLKIKALPSRSARRSVFFRVTQQNEKKVGLLLHWMQIEQ